MSEEISQDDIKMFRSTLLAKRFPGLKDLPDSQIRELLLADLKVNNRRLEQQHKTYPKTEFKTGKKSEIPTTKWVPVNAIQAKLTVSRTPNEYYLSYNSPYDADHQALLLDKTCDMTKRHALDPFIPTCSSQARSSIQVDYYLNSADKYTRDEERGMMDSIQTTNKTEYKIVERQNRGQMIHLAPRKEKQTVFDD
jgi:hypothetical protein